MLYFGCEHVKRDSIPLINNYMWLLALPCGWFYRSQFLFEIRIIYSYGTVSNYFYLFHYRMVAILEFCIKIESKCQNNIWFGILAIEFIEKMYLYKVIGALVQNLIFQNGVGGHLWFWLLEKISGIFGRDMEAKFFIKGPKKSNQASNLTSQRMVTESRFMTQLII